MRNLNFTTQNFPQLNSWVGFDRMFDELERATERTQKVVGYPPYNVKKVDDSHYVIEMAVAGFGKSDIDITMKEDTLLIKGEVKADPSTEYIYKGIAERAFERQFTLADSVIVKNASMVNGMLKVWLEHFIPEEKKPKKIEINDAETPDLKTVADTKQFLTEE